MDPDRLSGLVGVGVDVISWKKHHNYLTLVSDRATGKIVWGKAGKDTETLNVFFGELSEGAAEELEAVSMDLGPAYARSVRANAPRTTICFDPFPVVKLVTDSLDAVRRQVWQSARKLRDKSIAKRFKRACWALLKNLIDLTEDQNGALREIKRTGGALRRACQLKESLRAVFAGDLDSTGTCVMLDRWCSKVQWSRIPEFVKTARTIRKHRDGIDADIGRGLSIGRQEELNNKVHLIIRRAYGFRGPEAALATVMLACGPVNPKLPCHTTAIHM